MINNLSAQLDSLAQILAIDKQMFYITQLKGGLPQELEALKSEEKSLERKIKVCEDKIVKYRKSIEKEKSISKSRQDNLARYEKQKDTVSNSKEYASLAKAVELETLEVQLCQKSIKEMFDDIEQIENEILEVKSRLQYISSHTASISVELEAIVSKKNGIEVELITKRKEILPTIQKSILQKYDKVRKTMQNGLGASFISRSACESCFMIIPIQTQIDVSLSRETNKLERCQYCGSIFLGVHLDETEEGSSGIAEETNTININNIMESDDLD